MGENDLRIVVEQPMDWVGSVLVPVAAILVSSLIAIAIASLERRAADNARIRQAAAEVVRELGAITTAAKRRDAAAINDRAFALAAEVNVLAAMLPRRRLAVPKFIGLVVSRSLREGDPRRVESTAAWATALLDGWLRGDIKVKALKRAMPEDEFGEWTDDIDPADWPKLISGRIVL